MPDSEALHRAVADGDLEALRQVLDYQPTTLGTHDAGGYSALHLAARSGQVKAVELLLGRGADPRDRSTDGANLEPLNLAAWAGETTVAHLLLDRGAEVDWPQQGNVTPLHTAASSGHLAMVELLLGRGADPAACTDEGLTALELTNDPAIAHLLPHPSPAATSPSS